MSFITPEGGWEDPWRVPPNVPAQSLQNTPAFCGHCGNHLPSDLKFCTGCGVAVAPVTTLMQSQPPQTAALVPNYQQHYQQPYAPAVFQPQITQQVTIVYPSAPRSQLSGWVIFFLLFIPLWPISIPILILVWFFSLFRD